VKLFSHRKRPVHLGPYPLERLPRLDDPSDRPVGLDGAMPPRPGEADREGPLGAGHAFRIYEELFDRFLDGEVSPPAPIPGDPDEIAANLKAGLYFLDADMVGTALVPGDAWTAEPRDHGFAVVTLIGFTRDVGGDQPGDAWIRGTRQRNADLRAAELAGLTASYIRKLGYRARAHSPTSSEVDIERIALQAGLVEIRRGQLRAPYLRSGFGLSVVTTDLEMTPDSPLARRGPLASLKSTAGPGWLIGWGGTRARWGRLNGDHRPLHMGRYPMERIKRVSEPTSLVIEDEVPRVPKRAAFFERAKQGDFGPKFQRERGIFAFKTPSAQSYVQQIGSMVPFQDGEVADEIAPGSDDPVANTDALKALAYHLGGDMVGVCRVPRYAWFSHREDGTEIVPYHENAVVILLDQGYETMEGASGDDWISGAQSMRAYMRGAQIAGLMAEHIRSLGWSARSQTNVDSDVLHIPLVLHAGLGELSRIGELVLNPFVGPRFKSVVMTTDMPIVPDDHVDFGLQDFCAKCTKCARECPCGAISFGEKVMFNGYEMWKPDVEKCTKYRLGNLKGSACGRCMKTCPFNIEGVLSERLFLWAAIKLPFARAWIARLDDRVGNGSINPVKKWWWDLEWIDGATVVPAKGTNRRELDMKRNRLAARQKIAIYPEEVNPPADSVGVPVKLDRKAAVEYGERVESPSAARRRLEVL
jgi:reductive dehalogenase